METLRILRSWLLVFVSRWRSITHHLVPLLSGTQRRDADRVVSIQFSPHDHRPVVSYDHNHEPGAQQYSSSSTTSDQQQLDQQPLKTASD
jgi:hypothetical protein